MLTCSLQPPRGSLSLVCDLRRRVASAVAAVLWAIGPALCDDVRPTRQVVEDLFDTQFVGSSEGWAVGAFGVIYHTVDGGARWRAQQAPTTQNLYGVSFVDAERGWAVGRSGAVLRTADGGRHWVEQVSSTRKHLFKVCFTDARNGWAVGDWGTVIHTRDGGATWLDESIAEDQILYSVDFADRDHGWMVGEFGVIRRTRDGGKTWEKQPAGTRKTLFGVAAVDVERAWVVGIESLVMRTRDGGMTWETQNGEKKAAAFESIGFVELLNTPGLYDVEIRGGKGYIVGDAGRVLVSEDGGETWAASSLPAQWRYFWMHGVSVETSGRAMLVGASGLTLGADGQRLGLPEGPRP